MSDEDYRRWRMGLQNHTSFVRRPRKDGNPWVFIGIIFLCAFALGTLFGIAALLYFLQGALR